MNLKIVELIVSIALALFFTGLFIIFVIFKIADTLFIPQTTSWLIFVWIEFAVLFTSLLLIAHILDQ